MSSAKQRIGRNPCSEWQSMGIDRKWRPFALDSHLIDPKAAMTCELPNAQGHRLSLAWEFAKMDNPRSLRWIRLAFVLVGLGGLVWDAIVDWGREIGAGHHW